MDRVAEIELERHFVQSQQQSGRTTHRLIVLSRDGTEVLLKNGEDRFVFPSVEIPRWERLAENLTAALRRDWGCNAVCLFTLGNSTHDDGLSGNRYEVMECWHDAGRTREAAWIPARSLTTNSFQQEAEFSLLQQCLHQLETYEHDPSAPFARRGWLAGVQDWTSAVIRPLGLELSGPLRQYNASPAFNLIRFETTGPAVWFKAVGEPNQREFPITLKLAQRFRQFMAEIIATKPEWSAWLSREVEGANLGDVNDIELWQQAAAALANLQIESISECEFTLQLGAHDLRPDALLAAADPFCDLVAGLMERQPKVPPPTLNRQEISLLKLRIEDSLTLLDDLEIPNALGHLDLNPWNILISADRCVFLDWAEAYIGHPFLSLEYLLQHFRRAVGTDTVFESQLVEAYKAPWRQLLSDDLICEALPLVPLAAVFAYAAGTGAWKDEERMQDPKVASYLRGLARRMNREAIQLVERRSSCHS